MMKNVLAIGLVCCVISESQAHQETDLINKLLTGYNSDALPKDDPSDTVQVKFSLYMTAIIDLDPVKEVFLSSWWLYSEWTDPRLTWTPSDHGGIEYVHLPFEKIWNPGVKLYNGISDEKTSPLIHSKVRVKEDGSCRSYSEGVLQSTCAVDPTWYPYDTQTCNLIFGSSMYYGNDVNITTPEHDEIKIRRSQGTKEWVLAGSSLTRGVYNFTEEKYYVFLKCKLNILRKSYHTRLQVFFPPALLSILSVFVFLLPVTSKERVTLGIIQLALLGSLWRETSQNVHHAFVVTFSDSFYYAMFFGSFLCFMLNILVVNFYHNESEMPSWIRSGMRYFGRVSCTTLCNKYHGELTEKGDESGDTTDICPSQVSSRSKGDWIMLSQFLDRIFILFYFVFFTLSCTCIFATIPTSSI